MDNVKTNAIAKLIDSHDNLIALVHANWCGHCQSLKPKWENMVKKNKISFGENVVDIEQEELTDNLKSKLGDIPGYPTIISFGTNGDRQEYSGERTEEAITAWIKNILGTKENHVISGRDIKKSIKNKRSKKKHSKNKRSKNKRKKTNNSQSGGFRYQGATTATSNKSNRTKIGKSTGKGKGKGKGNSKGKGSGRKKT